MSRPPTTAAGAGPEPATADRGGHRTPPARLWPLYAGGFIGPFGGTMVAPMLPEVASGLGTTVNAAAWTLTAYMIPFATVMVVSGTLAERWGRRRTVRTAYVGYAVSSLLCALAPHISVLLAGRALQGLANAFTTPILVAAISDLVPKNRLGASLGKYGSLQAAGQSFAPLVGGVAAALQWRGAFVVTIAASVALVLAPFPQDPVHDEAALVEHRAGRVRALLNRRLALACGVAFLVHSTGLGTTVLTALLATDRFGLGPATRGLVVATFGAFGLLVGARLGRWSDQIGIIPFGVVMTFGLAVSAALAGLTPVVVGLVAAMAVAGATATGCRVVVTRLAIASTPLNRGGATSLALAWQFFGGAVGPILWLPVYGADHTVGMVACASGALGAAVLLSVVFVGQNRAGAAGVEGVPRTRPGLLAALRPR